MSLRLVEVTIVGLLQVNNPDGLVQIPKDEGSDLPCQRAVRFNIDRGDYLEHELKCQRQRDPYKHSAHEPFHFERKRHPRVA